jgi:hypothetical protein
MWGLSACDGPVDASFEFKGQSRLFHTYTARGAGIEYVLDDGTIAPTAAIGSIAFDAGDRHPTIEAMPRRYGAASTASTDSSMPSTRVSSSTTRNCTTAISRGRLGGRTTTWASTRDRSC